MSGRPQQRLPTVESLESRQCDYFDTRGRQYYFHSYDAENRLYMLWYLLPKTLPHLDATEPNPSAPQEYTYPGVGDDLVLLPSVQPSATLITATIETETHVPTRRVGSITATCKSHPRTTESRPPPPPPS